jgi:hypothetical protein
MPDRIQIIYLGTSTYSFYNVTLVSKLPAGGPSGFNEIPTKLECLTGRPVNAQVRTVPASCLCSRQYSISGTVAVSSSDSILYSVGGTVSASS